MKALLPLTLLLVIACDGRIGEPPLTRGEPDVPGVITPALCAEAPLDVPATTTRLLDAEQYTNALREVLRDETLNPALDERMGELVTSLGAERLNASLETIVQSHSLGDCGDDTCAKNYLAGLAARAFRRPLDASESAMFDQLFDAERAHSEFPASVREASKTVAQVILQSPQMLYVVEEGDAIEDSEVRKLRGQEVASRLSLLLWNSVPDAPLQAAADEGRLDDTEGIRAEAERMLEDPRAREMVRSFFSTWLGLDGSENQSSLEDAAKDEDLYPEMSDPMRQSMREELGAFVERVVFDERGTTEDLFTDRSAYVDAELATLYGVVGPESGREWVELDAGERAGILTRAAFLSVYSGTRTRSPIRRGVFVLQNALCQPLGEPPPNANDVAVEGGDTGEGVRSIRDDVSARTGGSECTACHNVINPVGFSFAHYDAIGRFQTEELHVVDGVEHVFERDASGSLRSGSDVDGDLADALDLSRRLATSPQVADCLATRFYEYAMRRHATPADLCSIEAAKSGFRESGRIIDLIVAVAQTDAFRHVRQVEEE